MLIPSMVLKKLYTLSSLKNLPEGVLFSVKNRLSDARLIKINLVRINGKDIPLDQIVLELPDGRRISPLSLSASNPLDFPLRQAINLISAIPSLPLGKNRIELQFKTEPFGDLKFEVEDSISEAEDQMVRIPRSGSDNLR